MKDGKLSILFALVLLAGFLLAVLSPPEPAAAATLVWEATGGMGNVNNAQAWSQAVFQSGLYVGTVNVIDGPEIYRFDGETWETLVGAGAPEPSGFGDPNAVAMACMAVYDGHLYVGTGTIAGACEVWRYDGAAWTAVVGGGSAVPAGFGGNNVDAMSMAVYGGELYLATRNYSDGVEIWGYDGTTWTQSVGNLPSAIVAAGFGDVRNAATFGMFAYRDNLYAGTFNMMSGCEVWAFDGTAWTQSVGNLPQALIASGFGSANNTIVLSMEEYEGSLYVGTQNMAGGCEVWSFDTVNWTQEVGALPSATIGPGFGDATNDAASSLHVYDSRLFVGTNRGGGCEVWSFDGTGWRQDVGGGAPADYTSAGFGDAANTTANSTATFGNRMYFGTSNPTGGCQLYSYSSSTTWYLAEGSTATGFETWVLVQNPNPNPVNVELTFQTRAGPLPGPTDTIPGDTRKSYLVNTYVPDNDNVSTRVEADADIYCERAMYWTEPGTTPRRLGHDSIGVVNPSPVWYLAEGATIGGFETWVLVQNPNPNSVNIDLVFQTDLGEVQGPQEALGGYSRKSYRLNDYVSTYDVSTTVTSYMGDVVCERAVYYTPPVPGFDGWELGTDSIGVVSPSTTWYLAEGATAGGFQTWILVQNPNDDPVDVTLTYQTGGGEVPGPVDNIPGGERRSYLADATVPASYDVSTMVTSTGGPVVCERAMYEAPSASGVLTIGHDSIGATVGGLEWFLPEGATLGGFTTYVLVQNPNAFPVTITLTFQTERGEVAGPTDTLDPESRKTYAVNTYVPDTYDVSTRVTSAGGYIICERAMYWRPFPGALDYLGTDSIGYRP
ncbi:MAG: DUF5719 family protein [Actinomycetota bacterium]